MRATAAFLLALAHLALSHAWNCKPLTLSNVNQIDAGLGQVVATDRHQNAFFLSGTSWSRLPSARLKHIPVGPAGIWGVNNRDFIYKYGFGKWIRVPGGLRQIDAGSTFVVGVNSRMYPYCLRHPIDITYYGKGSAHWTKLQGSFNYTSCGPYGCWVTDTDNRVWLKRSVNPITCQNPLTYQISGVKLMMIEVSTDGSVFGVSPSGQVFTRTGVSARRPGGVHWTRIPMCMSIKHVTYDLGRLWVVSRSDGLGMVCTH